MGRCKNLDSLNPLLSYASRLFWASILCFSHILSSLGLTMEWLQPDGCWMAGILLLPECPSGSGTHGKVLESLMIVTSLFIDTAGNISFLRVMLNPSISKWSHVRPQLTPSPNPFPSYLGESKFLRPNETRFLLQWSEVALKLSVWSTDFSWAVRRGERPLLEFWDIHVPRALVWDLQVSGAGC